MHSTTTVKNSSEKSVGRGSGDRVRAAVGFALMIGASIGASSGFAAIVRVGSDPVACDYVNLATAILNATDGDELRLETMEFNGASGFNFNITSIGLVIRGGYANCSAALPTGRSILRGGGADTVVEIRGPTSFGVVLENLIITGGEDDNDDGGGVEISGDIDVVMLNVLISGNDSERGAGVLIDGSLGATLSTRYLSIDGNNATVDGGGIYCRNGGLIEFNAQTQLLVNHALNDGGGGWLGSGCHLDLLGSPTGADDYILVQDNRADGDGGGFFIDGATVLGTGGRQGTLQIRNNEAGDGTGLGFGGGVYITGDQARLDLDRALLQSNDAGQGGGFYAEGPTVEVTMTQTGPCEIYYVPTSSLCSTIGGNRAGFGAAMVVLSGAFADIEYTKIEYNKGPTGLASEAPIAYVGNGGELIMEGCLVYGNRIEVGTGSGVVDLGGHVQALSSTFSDNTGLEELFWVGGGFTGVASIFDTAAGDLFDVVGSADWTLDCAVIPVGTPNLPGATQIVRADPGLVDPGTGDFHLAADSVAIDFCFDYLPGLDRDLDYSSRTVGFGLDAGADEFDPPLFGDGFESGDLTAWSL
ncbi:MAG: hypothetical protein K8J08_04460 [Thermoanaerobaculia bacterium]|nr:hypothetical protein [Thermoanaerobaculia bacterium]